MDLNKELRQKLRQKIIENKQKNFQLPRRETLKLDKQIHKDKREMDTDKRLTPVMKKWFIDAMGSSPNIDVKTPSYILNNKDEEKLKFYKFLFKFIDDVKAEIDLYKSDMMKGLDKIDSPIERDEYLRNVDEEYKKKFKAYFTTPYIIYMSLMTDINVFEDILKI